MLFLSHEKVFSVLSCMMASHFTTHLENVPWHLSFELCQWELRWFISLDQFVFLLICSISRQDKSLHYGLCKWKSEVIFLSFFGFTLNDHSSGFPKFASLPEVKDLFMRRIIIEEFPNDPRHLMYLDNERTGQDLKSLSPKDWPGKAGEEPFNEQHVVHNLDAGQ